jgi:hypothetical protein
MDKELIPKAHEFWTPTLAGFPYLCHVFRHLKPAAIHGLVRLAESACDLAPFLRRRLLSCLRETQMIFQQSRRHPANV